MHIIAEVTHKCPAKCKHCPISDKSRRVTMSLKAFKRVLTLFTSYFEPKRKLLTISGGEPSILDNLKDYVEIARSMGFRVTIATNCYNVENILQANPDFVQISVDAYKELHDKVRGLNLWINVKKMLELMKEGKIKGFIRFTLTRENFDDLLRLRVYLDKVGLNNVKIFAMPIRNCPELSPTKEDILNVIRSGVAVLPKRCPAGKGQFVITPDMRVLDCIFHRQVLGYFNTFTFKELERIVENCKKIKEFPCGEPYWWVDHATLS